jgi:hypothetical protein
MVGTFQIDKRLGTFEEVAAAFPARFDALEGIRETVAELHPTACESASRRERSVSRGFGTSKARDWYAYAMPHKAHVNLGFFRGIHLPGPEGLLDGTGKTLRHVRLRAPDAVRRPGFLALLTAARDERARALNLD